MFLALFSSLYPPFHLLVKLGVLHPFLRKVVAVEIQTFQDRILEHDRLAELKWGTFAG